MTSIIISGHAKSQAEIYAQKLVQHNFSSKNNILYLNLCILNWCRVTQNNFSGWLLKKNIWGAYETEIYNVKFYQPIINQYWKILNSKFLN